MRNEQQPRRRRERQRRQEVSVEVTTVTGTPATTTARAPPPPPPAVEVETVVQTVTADAPDPATVTEGAPAPAPATSAITTTAVNGAGNAITIVIQQITTTPPASSTTPDLSALLSRLGGRPTTSVNAALASILSASLAAQLSASAAALSASASALPSQSIGASTVSVQDDDGGLSTGAIVGIALGALVAVLAAIALCMWAVGAARHRRAREDTVDMMGPSHLPDPYASAFISREVPGSFVRFHDDDDDTASIAPSQQFLSAGGSGSGGRGAPMDAGREQPYATGPHNAYDDFSAPEDDYLDAQSQRPPSDYRGSRAYTATY